VCSYTFGASKDWAHFFSKTIGSSFCAVLLTEPTMWAPDVTGGSLRRGRFGEPAVTKDRRKLVNMPRCIYLVNGRSRRLRCAVRVEKGNRSQLYPPLHAIQVVSTLAAIRSRVMENRLSVNLLYFTGSISNGLRGGNRRNTRKL
jgi:hypothetical protein